MTACGEVASRIGDRVTNRSQPVQGSLWSGVTQACRAPRRPSLIGVYCANLWVSPRLCLWAVEAEELGARGIGDRILKPAVGAGGQDGRVEPVGQVGGSEQGVGQAGHGAAPEQR